MKQVKVRFPAKLLDDFTTMLYEIGFITVISYAEEEAFSFGPGDIIASGVIPEDKADEFKVKFSKNIFK